MKKIIYEILRNIDSGKKEIHPGGLGISKELFNEIGVQIAEEKYVENITIQRGGMYNEVLIVSYRHARLTRKGKLFLINNQKKFEC